MKRLFGLKPLTILDLAAFCAMAGLLFAKAWIDMDYNWDSLAYHVPFAALRTGLVSQDQYILPLGLQSVYDGFPVVQDYLKGWLWKFSGNINAVNLPTVAALVGMCVALAAMLRLPFSLLLFAAMAIPVIHVAAVKTYVDIISNAAFATALDFILDSIHEHGTDTRAQPAGGRCRRRDRWERQTSIHDFVTVSYCSGRRL
jgi:hypothetical protein